MPRAFNVSINWPAVRSFAQTKPSALCFRNTPETHSGELGEPISMASGRLSGINAILYYLNDIFARAGFNKVSGDIQAVAVGATNLLFTMLAMSIIDRIGRKVLLLVGSVGTAVCLAGVASILFTGHHESILVWFLVGYIAFFAFSHGSPHIRMPGLAMAGREFC